MDNDHCLTLGSLFDGSGGFPYGGMMSGILPIWASEIEPFAIRVTTKRLPFIKHYGDVSKLKGSEVEPVDIITFGSPCQDMSIAGKREGLDGKRSGLFFDAIRIVKEMRESTDGRYPRFLVWENVTGAFSSNGGADFEEVLKEICSIKGYKADTARPSRWPNAGEIVADDFSLAWRVFDAQYWGVPQRRKRIYLVADLADRCAGKILFESEGLSGYTPQGFRSWQEPSCDARKGIDEAGSDSVTPKTLKIRCGCPGGGKGPLIQDNRSATLGCNNDQTIFVPTAFGVCSKNSNAMLSDNPDSGFYEAETSRTLDGNGGNPSCNQGGIAITHPVYSTSKASYHTQAQEDIAPTLVASDYKDPPTVTGEPYYIVRRLTPVECARLQGFPDWWCMNLETEDPDEDDIRFWREVFDTWSELTGTSRKSDAQIIRWLKDPHTDSAEYKLWGNGVALPCVHFVLSGIVYYAQFSSSPF